MLVNSSIIDFINKGLNFIQQKTSKITENSFLLQKLDYFILFMISVTMCSSLFMSSSKIVCFIILTVFSIILKILFTKGQLLKAPVWNVCLIIWFLICCLSVLTSPLFYKSLIGFSKTVVYLLFYFSVFQYLRFNKSKIKYVLLLIAGMCFFETIIGLMQNKFGVIQGANWQDISYTNPEDVLARVFGTLKPYNPNLFGGYILATLPASIGLTALLTYKKYYKMAGLFFIIFLLGSLVLFYSGCRSAYISLGAIICLLFVFAFVILKTDFKENKLVQKIFSGVVLLSAVCICAFFVFVPKITKRLASIFLLRGDSSSSFRLNVYKACLELFSNNWYIGIGPGNKTFQEIYGLYMVSGFDALSAYNIFLEMALESGIFSLLAYLGFVGSLLYFSVRFIKQQNLLEEKIIVVTGVLSVVGVLLQGFFDTIYFRPQMQLMFWLFVAIVSVVVIKEEENV